METSTCPVRITRGARRALLLVLVIAGLALVHVAPAGAAAEPLAARTTSAACSTQTYSGTRTIGTRAYELYVPPGLTGNSMLVLNLHGGSISASSWRPQTRMDQAADRFGFIVAHPQGDPIFNFWNTSSASSGDTTYLRSVVQDISQTWCVNPRHVHITGGSMGGWMAQRMLCHSADVFASGAAGAAGHPALDEPNPWLILAPESCTPSHPVSVLMSIGDQDPYYMQGHYGPAVAKWVADQHCPAPTRQLLPHGYMDQHRPCDGGTTVISRILQGVGHSIPSEAIRDRSNDELYVFFAANPRPF
jgi:polyhydroxybutyrate depolymerase